MSLLKQFITKRTDKKLTKALTDLNSGKYKRALKAKHFTEDKKPEFAAFACKITGLAYYKLANYSEATTYLTKTAELENTQQNWSNLANAATRAGQIEKGEEAFKNVFRSPSEKAGLVTASVPYMMYHYMTALRDAKEYNRAFAQLNELAKVYIGLGTTDQQVLFNKYVPFINQTFLNARKILTNIKHKVDLRHWANGFGTFLDEQGKEELDKLAKHVGF